VHEQLDRQLPRTGDDRRAHGEGLGELQLVEQRLAGSQLEAAQQGVVAPRVAVAGRTIASPE
jgi:hypothetical protein